jgi:hypothetical protein
MLDVLLLNSERSALRNGDGTEKSEMQEPVGSEVPSLTENKEQEILTFQESPDAFATLSSTKELVIVTHPSKDNIAALHINEPIVITPAAVCSS